MTIGTGIDQFGLRYTVNGWNRLEQIYSQTFRKTHNKQTSQFNATWFYQQSGKMGGLLADL